LEIKQTSIKSFVQSFKNCQDDQKKSFFSTISSLSLNDEITSIFKDVGGMEILANSFIQSNQDIQESLLILMRNNVDYNRFFPEYLGKNSEFLKHLTTYCDETEDIISKLNISGILLCLARYISNKEVVKRVLENIIFPIIRDYPSYKTYMDKTLDCLMETSKIDESKSILLKFGTKEIIQPFVDDQDSDYHFIGCIIQAFLSSNEVNQNNEFGSNPASPKVISKISEVINTFINSDLQSYEYTGGGYLIFCYNILKALGSLARNEANMKELKNNGIVKKIIEFTQNRKDNLLKSSDRTIEELSTLIWILSFDQDCKNEFLSNGVVEILKGFDVKGNENVKRAINGALFTLIGNQNENQNRNERKRQVMISYCWTQKEQARRIANYLKSKNILVWIDIEQTEERVSKKMIEAVEESSVILILISSRYKESRACRIEAEYADKLKKEIIYIMAEENYQPRGWLRAILGNNLYYNPWKNMVFIEQLFSPILSQLIKLLNQYENSVILPSNQEKNQDQTPKPTQSSIIQGNGEYQTSNQIIQDSITISQSTNNDQNQNQQILDHLEKIMAKMDGFEKRLQKVEENFENVNKKLENFEAQTKENHEGLEKIEQKFEKLEIQQGKL